jgi:hypothetical protein
MERYYRIRSVHVTGRIVAKNRETIGGIWLRNGMNFFDKTAI